MKGQIFGHDSVYRHEVTYGQLSAYDHRSWAAGAHDGRDLLHDVRAGLLPLVWEFSGGQGLRCR
jgi:hypothetical protein